MLAFRSEMGRSTFGSRTEGPELADWKPDLYLQFERDRSLPARDLISRLPKIEEPRIVDIGCGPGNSTELLLGAFPDAHISGVDNSPAMIEAARKRLRGVEFKLADIAAWRPEQPCDIIFANAVLQWLPGRLAIVKALAGALNPGGCLAVQMPDNLDEPSHRLMREVAARPRFADALAEAAKVRVPIEPLDVYYDALCPLVRTIEVWRTTYLPVLGGPDAIVGWVTSTGLKPFIDALQGEERAAYLAEYREEITKAYPPRYDGRVLLPFPRAFIVARR